MGLKLYYGGFGNYMEYVVADSEEQAILKIGVKINAPFLPITASEITEVDGFEIRPVPLVYPSATETFTTLDEKPIEAEEVEIISNSTEETEIKTEITLRHCKKCDFTCETQGELLRHYRELHGKGD